MNPSTAAQNKVVSLAFLLSIFVAAVLSTAFASSLTTRTADKNPIELRTTINPNTAPVASLIRLPGIGLTRASAIIEYRNNFPNNKAYQTADDLQNIHGIGPKTVQKISPYLILE